MRQARVGSPFSMIRAMMIAAPVTFLIFFFVLPVLYLVWISLHQASSGDLYAPGITFENYIKVAEDPFYRVILLRTLGSGLIVTGACLLIGHPMAFGLSLLQPRWRPLVLALLLFPLMLSNVIRAYGWIAILGRNGVINNSLALAGAIERPLNILYTFDAVVIGLLTILLPYLVLSILNALNSIDLRLIEAAKSLGAGPVRTFMTVTWPMTAPGVASGLIIVFLLMLSAYVTITLLGGPRNKLLVSLIFDASTTFDWPIAATLAIVLLITGLVASLLILAWLRPGRVRGAA